MSTLILHKNNREHFRNLISSSVFEQIGEPGILAMGSVNEKKQAVGAMVCRFNASANIQVIWLYVEENSRGKGYGSELYSGLIRASKGSYERILCIFEDDEKYDDILFFMMAQPNTTFVPVTEDLVSVSAKDIYDKVSVHCKNNKNLEGINDIPGFLIKSEIQNMSNEEIKKNAPLLDTPLNIDLYSDGSCGIVEKDQLKGMLLCRATTQDKHYAVTFFDNKMPSPVPILQMLTYATKELLKKAADSMLTISTLNGFGKAVSKLADGNAVNTVLTCSVTKLK